ncbi:MAG: hypothetical protein JWM70_1927 [Microbacteriaceae bacterium]|nr:hypothetical protein [Microbacteriaceae bacterium]
MTALEGPFESLARRIGTLWWALIVIGITWIVIGFVVIRFDNSTVAIVSVIFGIMVLLAATGEFFRAGISVGGWRGWHLIFGILLVIAAIIAFINPGGTFVSLAIVAGLYFIVAGTFDIISSLFSIAFPGWWLQLLSGIAELVLGFLASNSFASSAVVLVTLVSVLAVFRGVSEIAAGFAVRAVANATK